VNSDLLEFEPIVSHVTRDGISVQLALIRSDEQGYHISVGRYDTNEDTIEKLWTVGTEEEAKFRAGAYLEGYARGYDAGVADLVRASLKKTSAKKRRIAKKSKIAGEK